MKHLSILILLTLTTCGGSGDDIGTRLLVVPGGYDTWTCTQITNQIDSYLKRQKVLEGLMAKAGTDLGGRIASGMAYDAEYAQNRGFISSLRQTATEKNCLQ